MSQISLSSVVTPLSSQRPSLRVCIGPLLVLSCFITCQVFAQQHLPSNFKMQEVEALESFHSLKKQCSLIWFPPNQPPSLEGAFPAQSSGPRQFAEGVGLGLKLLLSATRELPALGCQGSLPDSWVALLDGHTFPPGRKGSAGGWGAKLT